VVQVNERDIETVPYEFDGAVNILGALAGVQVDASKSLVIVGELLYEANNNLSDNQTDAETGENVRVPVEWNEANKLGFNVMMRARF